MPAESGGPPEREIPFGVDGTRSIPRPRRLLYVVSLWAAFLGTVGVGLWIGRMDQIAGRMGLRDLPVLGELMAALARGGRDPVWLGLALGGVVLLSLLCLKGLLDRILKLLIGMNLIWLILFLLAGLLSWAAFLRLLGTGGTGG